MDKRAYRAKTISPPLPIYQYTGIKMISYLNGLWVTLFKVNHLLKFYVNVFYNNRGIAGVLATTKHCRFLQKKAKLKVDTC